MYSSSTFPFDDVASYRELFVRYRQAYPRISNELYVGRVICTYAIVNVRMHEAYVGSTDNLWGRWNQHRNSLRFGNHKNVLLQRAFDAYGAAAFTLQILEQYDTTDGLLKHEATDALKHFDEAQLYNGRIGMKFLAQYPQQQDRRSPTLRVGRNSSARWFDGQTS